MSDHNQTESVITIHRNAQAARRAGRSVWTEAGDRQNNPDLWREQSGRWRGAGCDPAQSAGDREADRRSGADAGRRRKPHQGADVGGSATGAGAPPVDPRPRYVALARGERDRDRLVECIGERVTAQVGSVVKRPGCLRSGALVRWSRSEAYSSPAFGPSTEPNG